MDYNDWKFGPPTLDKGVLQSFEERPFVPLTPPSGVGGDNPYWKKTWAGAKREPQVIVIDNLPAAYSGLNGWTTCDKETGMCILFISSKADRQCVEQHERYHASGWDHPGYETSLGCYNSPIK